MQHKHKKTLENKKKGNSVKSAKGNSTLIGEIITFLKERKAWWIAPIVIVLVLVGLLIIFSQSSAISPFIYALF